MTAYDISKTAMQRKRERQKKMIETKSQMFNKTVNECIQFLTQENYKAYVEGIKEIAHQMKSAGSDNQSFMDLCKHIEDTAIKQSGKKFLDMHVKLAIRDEFQRQSGLIKV